MKKLLKRIRMKQRASKIRSKSVDPLKAHRGHVEIGIYTWLLNLIAKELETEKATSVQAVQTVQTVQAVTTAPTAPTVPTVKEAQTATNHGQ